jgi:hypothetical protein
VVGKEVKQLALTALWWEWRLVPALWGKVCGVNY